MQWIRKKETNGKEIIVVHLLGILRRLKDTTRILCTERVD